MSDNQPEYRTFLETPRQSSAFNKSYLEIVRETQNGLREKYVAARNVQRFFHGASQVSFREDEPEVVKMHSLGVEMMTKFQDIVDGDLSMISKSISIITNGLHEQFARSVYQTLSETCDKTGNTVDAKEKKSIADAFEEMMSKIEFIADKNENVSLPEIHAAPAQAAKMLAELNAQPAEYQDRIELLKKRKIEEAISKERARKARFAQYGK